ncbi:hypothetical protein [Entomohabitans teleogrylli]|uniref:hypothetical protein n=1 Tax=Entomohabitans teleogrylli TaxID=1384589 RepID=UPI00073D82E8|nr:hypothetical protein [Entomohabitans teleogrylli]
MQVNYRYQGKSRLTDDGGQTSLAFVPDSLRQPAFFVGELKNKLAFREAISALHNVVISDMRFQPKNRDEYQRWLAAEEQRLLAEFLGTKASLQQETGKVVAELATMSQQEQHLLAPFRRAQNAYFNYLYKKDIDAWYVLDPVITVHPDEVFFECFSEDESSYGKLSCHYEVFDNISDHAYGTTNIDYSEGLYQAFQKIRSYRQTQLKIDPDGFALHTDGSEFEEKKISLPDSWVRGFLQVSSAMTLPMVTFTLQPGDIYNLCYLLRRRKERHGPRALRFMLQPGQPVKVMLEPWGEVLTCPRSLYSGDQPREIRIWGRRRLHILERLIPVANRFDISLLGDGMPSFWVADLGDMRFTLGLSGWSANDWSGQGNFDLLAPRQQVDNQTLERVYQALSASWAESSASLAARLGLDEDVVKAALAGYSQHGQVLYDLGKDVYRIRALCREPIALDRLRFAHEREEKASNFVMANLVKVTRCEGNEQGMAIEGEVLDNAVRYPVALCLDGDRRLVEGHCACFYFHQHRLRRGPCEHLLALRQAAREQAS